MQEILKAFSFETQIAFLKTSSETFAMGLKNSLKQKIRKSVFFQTEFVYSTRSTRQMKGKFWNPDRNFFTWKSKIFHTLSEKKFKDWKKITEKSLFPKNASRNEKTGLTTLF